MYVCAVCIMVFHPLLYKDQFLLVKNSFKNPTAATDAQKNVKPPAVRVIQNVYKISPKVCKIGLNWWRAEEVSHLLPLRHSRIIF
jgi:hypothetical protein